MYRLPIKRYRKKGKWSVNIREINEDEFNIPASQGPFYFELTLTENPVQTPSTVSQAYVVKNPELTYELDFSVSKTNTAIEAVTGYIMYKPQGMTVTSDYNIQHPEYIMAYKYFGSPANDINDRYIPKIKSRLARTLQTGDSIIFLLKGNNGLSEAVSLNFHGLFRWWTKAN